MDGSSFYQDNNIDGDDDEPSPSFDGQRGSSNATPDVDFSFESGSPPQKSNKRRSGTKATESFESRQAKKSKIVPKSKRSSTLSCTRIYQSNAHQSRRAIHHIERPADLPVTHTFCIDKEHFTFKVHEDPFAVEAKSKVSQAVNMFSNC